MTEACNAAAKMDDMAQAQRSDVLSAFDNLIMAVSEPAL